MKKNCTRLNTCGRNPELGAIAIVVAALWMTLFGLAAFAVDVGYAYTNKRGLKAVADASVRAGMKTYATSDLGATAKGTATAAAQAIATANGFSSGVTVSYPASPNRLQVEIQFSQPTYFLKLFGLTSKVVTVRSAGEVLGGGGAAIYSNDTTVCGTQWDNSKGIDFAGGGVLKINGNIESKNKIHIGNPSGTCNGVNCAVTGAVKTTSCQFWNDAGTAVMGVASAVTGATLTDPIPTWAAISALCTTGTVATPLAGVPCNINIACPTGCMVPPGIYCSSAGINVSPSSGTDLCMNNVTLVSAGAITITGSGAITMSANPAAGGVAVYSNFSGGGPAIQMSNGPLTLYTVNGSVFAPQGLINVGTGTPGFTMTGTLGGKVVNVSMGPGQPWTFNGGSTGSTWEMYE